MLPRKYNQPTSGVEITRPDIFIRTHLCHTHPPAQEAKPIDRPDVARCMTFFQAKAEGETDAEKKVEYLSAAAEDRELLMILKNKSISPTEDHSSESNADEDEEGPYKRQRV